MPGQPVIRAERNADAALGGKELPKDQVLAILRRPGISPAAIEAIDREVGDPVHFERDGAILANPGVTRDLLMSGRG